MLLLIQLRVWRILIIYSPKTGTCKNQESGSCVKCQGGISQWKLLPRCMEVWVELGVCLDAYTGWCLQVCELPAWHVGRRNSPFMLCYERHPLSCGQMRACTGGRTLICQPRAPSPGWRLSKRERRLRLSSTSFLLPAKVVLRSANLNLAPPWLEHETMEELEPEV